MDTVRANAIILYHEHNLRQVYPGLFVSDMTMCKNVAMLKRLGISAVLNLLSHQEDFDATTEYCREEISFLHLPMNDKESFRLDNIVDAGTDFIERCLRGRGKILVYSGYGMSRSPAMVIAYFITKLGMTFDEARLCVGSRCAINRGFLDQLSQLERERSFASRFGCFCGRC